MKESFGKNKLGILVDFLDLKRQDFINKIVSLMKNSKEVDLDEKKKEITESKERLKVLISENKDVSEDIEERELKIQDIERENSKKDRKIKELEDDLKRLEIELSTM